MQPELDAEIVTLLEREFRAGADPNLAATQVIAHLREKGYSKVQAVFLTVNVVDRLIAQNQRRN